MAPGRPAPACRTAHVDGRDGKQCPHEPPDRGCMVLRRHAPFHILRAVFPGAVHGHTFGLQIIDCGPARAFSLRLHTAPPHCVSSLHLHTAPPYRTSTLPTTPSLHTAPPHHAFTPHLHTAP
eukprot:353893-Chlamydomonas_euryale.AAC.19